MREFIIRDINRFWITFGQETAYGQLMDGIGEGNAEKVQSALDRGGVSVDLLTNALIAATSGDSKDAVIVELLRKAGAVAPPKLDNAIVDSYAGHYKDENNMEVDVVVKEGQLFAVPKGAEPISLVAVNETTFRPLAFDGVTVTFRVEGGKTVGFQFKQGSLATELKRT
jgi:hypothetical protein